MIMKFRDNKNNLLTTSLFYELCTPKERNAGALYSLERRDTGLLCLRDMYLAMGDVLEDTFAKTYFESVAHWELVSNHEAIKPYITGWRKELELRIRSEALQKIVEHAEQPTPTGFQAAKFLVQGLWKSDEERERTPNKAKITKNEIKNRAKEQSSFDLDSHFEKFLTKNTNAKQKTQIN